MPLTTTAVADADTAAAAAALMLASQQQHGDAKMMRNQAPTAASRTGSTMPASLVSVPWNDDGTTTLASQQETSSIPTDSVTTHPSKAKVSATPLHMDIDSAAPMALARPTETSQNELSASMSTTRPPATLAGLASPRLNDVHPSPASFTAVVNGKNAPFQSNHADAAAAAAAVMDAHAAAAVLALASQNKGNTTPNYVGNAAMHQVVEASSLSLSAPAASPPSAASVSAPVVARHYYSPPPPPPPPIAASLAIAPTPAAAAAAATTSPSRNAAVSRSLPVARPAAMNIKKVKDSKKRVSPSASPQSNRKKRARKNDSKGPDYDIFEVTHNDVLSGRGNGVAHSPGNVQFREVVLSHKAAYVQTDNLDLKAALAEDVISTITNLKPPGRFLEKNPNGEGWREMTKRQVFAKTCQALREKAHWNALTSGTTGSITTVGAARTPDKMNAKGDGKANVAPTDGSEPSPSSFVSPAATALATMDDDDDDNTASTVTRPASPATTADGSLKTTEAIISPPSSASKPVKAKTKIKADRTVKNRKEPPATTLCYQRNRKRKGSDQAIDHNLEYCIFQTSETDVLSGRGNGVATRPGNAYFRRLVYFHKEAYVDADRDGKIAVAQTVIAAIRKLTPPGRFLEKDPNGAGWREMTDRQVFLKTCQALREKTHWGNHAKEANQNLSRSDCANGLVMGATTAAAAASAGNSPNTAASKVQAPPSPERLGVVDSSKKSKKGGDATTQDPKCLPPRLAASPVSIENGSPATVVDSSDQQQIVKSSTRPNGDGTEARVATTAAAAATTPDDDDDSFAADTCEV